MSGRASTDFYKLLMVDAEADPEIIAVAYRKLAQRYHPDVTDDPDAVAKMAAINAAYDVLKDPERRAAYDRERRFGPGHGRPGARPAGTTGTTGTTTGPEGSIHWRGSLPDTGSGATGRSQPQGQSELESAFMQPRVNARTLRHRRTGREPILPRQSPLPQLKAMGRRPGSLTASGMEKTKKY